MSETLGVCVVCLEFIERTQEWEIYLGNLYHTTGYCGRLLEKRKGAKEGSDG